MKNFALIFGLVAVLFCYRAQAQDITVVGPSATAGGNELFEFFLDTTGAEGAFDTFELVLTSAGLFNQVGTPAKGVMQPSEDSGFDFLLSSCPPVFDCFISTFGINAFTDTPSLVSGTFTSLGSTAISTNGNYRIAQVVMAPRSMGTYRAWFLRAGSTLNRPEGQFGVPEPASLALLGLGGLVTLVFCRRRVR